MGTKRKLTETFSSVDAAWLHMDTPTNLAVITGVLTFQGRMDENRLKVMLDRRLLVFTRFRQRVVESPLTLGLPRWEVDPDFHINRHVERITLPEPADHATLQQVVGEMMSQPLDRHRPLWKFSLTDLNDGKSALIVRLHHCIADGLALVQVLLSIADLEADGEVQPPLEYPPDIAKRGRLERICPPAARVVKTAGKTLQTAGGLFYEGMDTLIHPSRLSRAAQFGISATRSLGKLLFILPDQKTVLRGQCGFEKRAAWTEAIDVEEVKGIAHLMGGTINDILLSALTGALRRYLERRGDFVHDLDIRGVVPVSLRPADELDQMGNQFGLVFLSLPVGVEDPLKRMLTLKQRMNSIKKSPEALVAFGILGTMGLTPTQIEHLIVTIFAMKGTAVLTNVPGPRHPLYFAGQRIDNFMFWVPTPGNLGLGVSILSYNGKVIIGVATDAGLIPDPENILESFKDELDYLKGWGRPSVRFEASVEAIVKSNGSGPPEELAADMPDRRCQAITRAGKRCRNAAMSDGSLCRVHQNAKVEIYN